MSKNVPTGVENFKVDQGGRTHISKKRKDALLSEFDQSGMSGLEFARSVGIKYSTWSSWVRKRRERKRVIIEGGVGNEFRWIEAKVDQNTAESARLVIHGPNGIRFEIENDAQANLAAKVLHYMGRVC